MKPEEIIYNAVLKLDPNYSTEFNDFSTSIYNNRELLEGLSEDLYSTATPEVVEAIDKIRSSYNTGQDQGGNQLPKRVVAYSPSQNQRTVYEYDEVKQLLGTPGYNYNTVEDYVDAQNATSGQKWSIEDPNLATQLEEFEVTVSEPEIQAAKDKKQEREDQKKYEERVKKTIPLSLFTRNDDVDVESQASGLASYLQKLFPTESVSTGKTGTFGQVDEDKVFITGLADEEVVIDLTQDAAQNQRILLDTLLSLDKEALDIEALENIVNQEQLEFESLTAFNDTAENSMFSIPTDVLSYVNDMVNDPNLFTVSDFKVEETRDDTDIFNGNLPFAESTAARTNTLLINSSGVQPYQDELNQARLELLNAGVDFTEEDVQKRAREIIKQDYLKDYRSKQFEKYIEGDIDGIKGLTDKQKDELKFKSKKEKDDLESQIERRYELLKQYSDEIDNFGLNKDGSLSSKNKFSSSGFYYTNLFNEFVNNSSIEYNIQPGQDYYKAKDGRNIPAWLYDGHMNEINRFQELGELISSESEKLNEDVKKVRSSEQKFDIIRKNYNDLSKFGVSLGLATLDLVTSTAYGIYKLQSFVNPIALAMKVTRDTLGLDDPVDQAMMALKNWEEDVRDDYKDDIRYNDINSWSDVGQYTYQSIANQAPLIVSMIATGGLSGAAAKSAGITGKALQTIANVSSSSMVGLSSFGGKFSDMSYEEFKSGKDLYSDTEILFKSLGYGVSEGAFAYLSTAPLLNKGVGKITGVSDDLIERELSEGFRQEITKHLRKDILPETVGEMFFEGLTTGTQNLIDGRPFLENMKETIVSSGFWGAGMSGMPSLYTAGAKNFAHNKELNIINKSTRLANELRRKNSALINSMNSDGGLMTTQKLQAEIDANNKLIEKYEADAVDARLTVEENIREQGMLPEDASNFIEGQSNLANLREEAYQIQSDATKSKAQKEQELEVVGEIYNQAKKGMELFNNTETFGSAYGALMMAAAGKDKNNQQRKQYNKVTAEARKNLLDNNRSQKNPKSNYNPTGAEIAVEADNILFDRQMDKQLEKDRRQSEKLGHTFINFESREQAGQEISDAFDVAIELEDNASKKAQLEINKKETIAAINRGSLNGGSISTAAGGFYLDFVVRENMRKNKRFTSGLHENTHSITRKLLKNNPEAFKNLGDQLIKYLVYTGQTDALNAMGASNANLQLDGEFDYDEVISSFIELIAEDKVDLDRMDNFKAIMGKLLNDGLMDASDGAYNIEFKGQKDILEFFLGFGKKLAAGEVELSDLSEAQDRFNIVDKNGKVIPISDNRTQTKVAASKVRASETAQFSKADQDLFTKVNEVYKSNQSLNNKALEIGNLYRNFVTSRINKGFRVGKAVIRPRDFDGFNNEILEDVVSDMATGGSGIPGLVKAYASRDTSRFGSITLPQWINARLNQRILGYLPNDLVRNDMSIDSETAKQIEDAKSTKFTDVSDVNIDEGPRKITPVEELSIVTPELVDEVKNIVTKTLKRTALTEGISNETVLADLNKAIEKEITKVIKSKMGPITKSVLGFAPKQYTDFIKNEMMTIVQSMPVNLIKQKAKSKAWAEVFKLKEIGREDIKKVNPDTGKVTNYRKQIFEVQKPDPQKFQKYFTRAGYTTLIERQRSLIKPMAEQLTRSELARLRQDKAFISDLADRTGLNNLEVTELFVDNVIQDIESGLDNTASEVLQQDTVKFSETLAGSSDQSKQTFIDGLRSSTFRAMLADSFNDTNIKNPIKQTIVSYFRGKGLFEDLSNTQITKIANEFGNLTVQRQVQAEAKKVDKKELADIITESIERTIENPNDYKAIELALGISEINFDKKDIASVNIGRQMALKIAIKIGREKFIRLFAPGLQGPAGLSGLIVDKTPTSLELTEADVSGFAKTARTGLFLNVQDLFDNVINAKDANGNLLVGPSKGDFGVVSSKGNMDGRIFKKNWYFSKQWESLDGNRKAQLEFVNEIAREGDVNKEIYRETVLSLAGELTPTEARWMVSVDSGSMQGALKASASLIGFPNLNKSQLQQSLNLKSNDPYVLEHMTPAKYMALITYKYLLDPSSKNKKDFNTELDNFNTIILPEGIDDILRAEGKQASMGLKHKIGDSPFDTRYDEVLKVMQLVKADGTIIGQSTMKFSETNNSRATQSFDARLINDSQVKFAESNQNTGISVIETELLDRALNIARDPNAPTKKIRVFDFDDTLATSNNLVFAKRGDETIELNAEEFASQGETLLSEGYTFDFTDFDTVRDGARGPLFKVAEAIRDARGTKDVFVLTARAPEAQIPIREFLKSQGLDIPLENITGLGNSSGLAKASWIVDKAAQGYNDFYFADDAPQNVEAVKKVLDVIDVKSKVQQAKIKFSETVDQAMNDIIYQKTGIESFKEYSDVRAQAEGRGKRSFDLIPPSAEDFGGLLYRMLSKGKVGDAQWEWMQDNLVRPYNRGVNDLVVAQNTLAADFKALKESLRGIPKNLKKKAFGGFTFEDIVRVHTWNKQGINVEGISKRDLKDISDFINANPELEVFSDQLIAITKADGYYYPGPNWLAGTITTDFREGLRTTSRSRFLKQWQDNIDQAFSPKNLNKIEAAFGNKYREALEDSIQRMKTGTNRSSKIGRLEAQFLDYVNGSVGAVMFLNARSAVLQTISSLNFINWGDNNVFAAGRAFANQPQYWKDFMTLMNSDYLVDRRNGLKINVSENEIAEAAKTSKNKAKAVISTLLSKGFVLTQFADSFAIASGGATFYRNRIKKLMKEGMSESEATKRAFEDFKEISETSQQSADPSKISMQQASTIGKLILAWGNTPMQYNRIIKKATLDLVNNRGDWKDNISKIVYYGALQNIIFTTLQSALFAVAFSDDEEESDVLQEKGLRTANSLIDNLLRGIGIGGAVVSTIKNLGIEIYDRSKRKKPDYADVALKLLDVAPPIDVKVSKFRQGLTTYEYSQKDPRREEIFNLNNPSYMAAAKVIAATTNVPLDRLLQKAQNLEGAMNDQNQWWKRVAMFLGWPEWQLRSTKEATEFKELLKERRKQYKESKKRQYAYKAPLTEKQIQQQERAQDSISYFKLNKQEQVDKLDSLGLTKKEIRALRYEKDRVNKLLELME